MKNWKNGYISKDGMKIYYYRTGGDKPPVILNHGAGDDGLCWTRVANVLQKDYDVIMPDTRGHGKSTSGKGNYSTKARVSDLASLVEALGLEPPVIGGHSMGADTTLHFAAEYPHKVRGIFLEDPPIFPSGDTTSFAEQAANSNSAGNQLATSMLEFKMLPKLIGNRRAREENPDFHQDEIIPWIESKRRVSLDFLEALPEMGLHRARPIEAFKQVTVPILLFTGDPDQSAIVTQDVAQQIFKANNNVEVVHLAGASHSIRRTRFDGYITALQEFLESVHRS